MGKRIFGWYIQYIINGFRHEKDKFNVLYYNYIGLGLNYESTLEYYKKFSKTFYALMNMDTDLSIRLDKSTLEYYKHVSNNFYGLMNIDPELSIRWEIERWTNFDLKINIKDQITEWLDQKKDVNRGEINPGYTRAYLAVSYTHLRAHET